MPDESTSDIDPAVREMAERFLAEGSKRGKVLLNFILRNGSVTTEELEAAGYRDAASAARDVRDAGIPLITGEARSSTGGRTGRYTFGSAGDIVDGRFNGRTIIPKKVKEMVLAHYGSVDWLTGAAMPATALTVDHRVPFRVLGDPEIPDWRVEELMPLDKSSQRSKSWACEACANYRIRKPDTCRKCFWAFPESYEHIAMEPLRRMDMVWRGSDVALHDRMKARAEAEGVTMHDLLLRLARKGEG
jgi:hypothetical protein